MARALAHSFCGVFMCETLRDGVATFRGVHDGRLVAVTEHRMPAPYGEGWLGFGRMIPLGHGQHLRSDGMELMSPGDQRRTHAVERARTLMSSSLPPTLATEGSWSIARYDAQLPNEVPSWTDPAWARRQLAEFRDRWREFQSSTAGPSGVRGNRPPKLDAALTGWIAALEKLAAQPDSLSTSGGIGGGRRRLRLESPNDDDWYRDN
jgi:hypothetical protein